MYQFSKNISLGTNVFTNPRGLNAIIRQCNRIDLTRRSPSYEHRLAKYSSRGYEIYYPDLDRDMIDYPLVRIYPDLMNKHRLNFYYQMGSPDRSTFPKGLGRLIVYEIISLNYERFELLYAPEDDCSEPVPVDRLRHSNYDYTWLKIPYGDRWWSPERVKAHVENKVDILQPWHLLPLLNSRQAGNIIGSMPPRTDGVPNHCHVMTCGTMAECLERCCDVPVSHNTSSYSRRPINEQRLCSRPWEIRTSTMDSSEVLPCQYLHFSDLRRIVSNLSHSAALSRTTQVDKRLVASTLPTLAFGNRKHIVGTTTLPRPSSLSFLLFFFAPPSSLFLLCLSTTPPCHIILDPWQ